MHFLAGVTLLLAIPLVVAAFQVKRLQRWWEEAQGIVRYRTIQREKDSKDAESSLMRAKKEM